MSALDDSPRPGKEPTIYGCCPRMGGVAGLPEAQGGGISARALDDTTAGATRQGGNTLLIQIVALHLGRKNALFAGADSGGRHWAIVATLIQTAKLNDVGP